MNDLKEKRLGEYKQLVGDNIYINQTLNDSEDIIQYN